MSARALGRRQRNLLKILARPGTCMVVGDTTSVSLVRRGLADADANGHSVTITSAGLRALADEADAGRLDLRPAHGRRAEGDASAAMNDGVA